MDKFHKVFSSVYMTIVTNYLRVSRNAFISGKLIIIKSVKDLVEILFGFSLFFCKNMNVVENLKIYTTLGYIVSLILLNLGHVFRFRIVSRMCSTHSADDAEQDVSPRGFSRDH